MAQVNTVTYDPATGQMTSTPGQGEVTPVDVQKVYEAIRAADKAGDTEGVKRLAEYLKSVQGQTTPQPAQPPQQEQPQGWGDWLANQAKGFVLGAEKPLDNLTAAAMHIPGMGLFDQAGQALGLPSAQQAIQGNQQARAQNTAKVAQVAGNMAGTLPTLALPGGALAQGAVSGALLSDKTTPTGIFADAALGGVAGKGGEMIGNALSYAAKPVVSKAAQTLHDAGIMLTPGQLAKGGNSFLSRAVSGTEDRLAGLPYVGDIINQARGRGLEQLNHAVVNDALSGIGEKAPATMAAGHDLLNFAEKKLSERYQSVVPKLTGTLDDQFAQDLANAKAGVNVTGDSTQNQFERIVKDVFGNRMDETGATITGQNLKDAESRLTYLANKFSKSPDADQSILGESLFQVRQALRELAARSDPSGTELQAINRGWATIQQAKKAAGVDGTILPTALARQANKTGFGTDLARSAQQLMPSKVPDSGTAGRNLMADAFASGGGALAAFTHPGYALGAAAGALPYTKIGQKALNSFLFRDPSAASVAASNAFNNAAKLAPVVTPSLLSLNGQP